MQTPFRSVGLVGKHGQHNLASAVIDLARFIQSRGHEVVLAVQTADRLGIDGFPARALTELASEVDAVIVFGGDGTMLSIARTLAAYGAPLIGINQGHLGFLTDITVEAMYDAIAEILSGQYVAEDRILLKAQVRRAGQVASEAVAFNDIVVGKGGMGRLIDMEVAINGEYVYNQRSDGLIVTTPTGSTAYSLSAGGPIVHPTLEAFTIVPICPHTLTARPIVVSSESRIEIRLHQADDARVHFDGQQHFDLQNGDEVWVTRAGRPVTLLHPHSYSYYDTLREKLLWGKKL